MGQAKTTAGALVVVAGLALAQGAAGAAAAKPLKHPLAHSATVTGIVVHENNAAHSFVLTEGSGRLDAIHGRRPRVSQKVSVQVTRLANGTLAARKLQLVSATRVRRVKVDGVVSSDDHAKHELVVSASGVSMPIREDPSTSGDTAPSVGTVIAAEAELQPNGTLRATAVTDVGQSQTFKLEGKVLSVAADTRTLSISADDNGETASSVSVTLPDGFDLTAYQPGDCVELTVTKSSDGSFAAVQSFGDDNAQEADNHSGHGRGRGGPSVDQSDPQQGKEESGGGSSGSEAATGGSGRSPSAGSSTSDDSGPGGAGSGHSEPGGSGSPSGRR